MKDPYKNIANLYDKIFEPLNSGLRAIGLKLYPPDEGMAVLDVGCGTGAHLKLYQDLKCKVFGIDTSQSMIENARSKLGENAELHLGDASEMPYGDNQFDLIMSSTVLHEMPAKVRSSVLNESKRILNKNGRILLIDFNPGPIKPFKGWLYKFIITIAEIGAGGEHFRNYREFMKNGGLLNLIESHDLIIEKEKIVSGGNIAIYLIKPR